MTLVSDVTLLLWQHAGHILIVAIGLVVLHFVRNYFEPGVSSIPGPFWAKVSNLWRFLDVARGHTEQTHLALHKKYGQYVRIGPNVVSVCNVSVLKDVYGINKGYTKTGFYAVQQQLVKGRPTQTLFTSLNEDFHSKIKRPVASAYSMSTLTEFEFFVDKTIHTMVARLDEFARDGRICDMTTWLQYYAFDVIGELTFGKPLGFLERGEDVSGIMKSIEKTLDYAGKIGQMPWLDYLLVKNPLKRVLGGGATGAVAQFAKQCFDERLHPKEDSKTEKADAAAGRRDFLTRFLEAKVRHPETVNDAQVFSYTLTNVNAGSDTTAISLRAVIYYTLRNRRVLERLTKELEEAHAAGRLSVPVSWKESQQMPYLDAVIKEALRVHPAVGLLLERIVPEGGLKLPDGPLLKPGTVVGINPWVIHQHGLFGADPETFRPERWLQDKDESDVAYAARRQEMVGASFTFGAGPRSCIGKNISLLEMYKLIPTLLLTFKMELANPDAEWQTCNAWFVRQKGIDVKLERIRRRGF